jgi:DNA-binding transcriptional MerR regulator
VVSRSSLAASGRALRIGEAARALGVTPRTLRYWDELGLLAPSGHTEGGERLYAPSDVERGARIRELQELLGFSLSQIGAVVQSDDVLERLRRARAEGAPAAAQRRLLTEAIEANDELLARLDDTLGRVAAFRDERRAKRDRLRARLRALAAEAPEP